MNKGKKDYRLRRKVWIEPEMMESEAFKSLTGTQMWILLRFLQKVTWTNTKVGGQKIRVYDKKGLMFTYREAQHFGISDSTFNRAVGELVAKGFIDVEHQGGFYGRDCSRYRLSDRWKQYGTQDFIEVRKGRVLQSGLDVQSWMQAGRKREKPKLII
jgi:hypothetical protein